MNKKKLDKVNYKINTDSKIVVAILKDCQFDVIDCLCNVLDIDDYNLLKQCEISSTFRGVARCHPEDKFDVDIGKSIALSKLEEKYNKSFNKAADRLVIKVRNMVQSILK